MSRPTDQLKDSGTVPVRRKSSVGEVLLAINSEVVALDLVDTPKSGKSDKPSVDAGAELAALAVKIKRLRKQAEVLSKEAEPARVLDEERYRPLAALFTVELQSKPGEFDPWLVDLRKLASDVDVVEQRMDNSFKEKAASLKGPFTTERKKFAADIERFDAANFGKPPPDDLKDAWEGYAAVRPQLRSAEDTDDYGRGLVALTMIREAIVAINNALQKLETKLQRAENIAKSVEDYKSDEAFKELAEKVKAALTRAQKANEDKDFAEAYKALDAMEAARGELREASASALLDAKGATKAEVLKKAMALVDKDPGMLTALVAKKPAGEKLLDELVESLGGKAKGKAGEGQKAFVRQAIIARYGLEEEGLTGILSTKALPRLYKVMGMVPASHTLDNPALKQVERRREGDESVYDIARKKVTVTCKRTGWNADSSSFDPDSGEKSKVPLFDAHTLHEIGHAVDAKEKFMDGAKGKESQHGGWEQELTPEAIADKLYADAKFGFAATWESPDCPAAFLKAYLVAALKGHAAKAAGAGKMKDTELLADAAIAAAEEAAKEWKGKPKPVGADANAKSEAAKLKIAKAAVGKSKSKDADVKNLLLQVALVILGGKAKEDAVRQVLAEFKIDATPDEVDWAALAKDPAVKWCETVRLKGSSTGLWDSGASGATAHALSDKRVYQEAYRGKWVSYELTARAAGVSSYQFRAPGEWFAEAYSAFFLRKLKDSHPLHSWLQEQLPPDHPLKKKAA